MLVRGGELEEDGRPLRSSSIVTGEMAGVMRRQQRQGQAVLEVGAWRWSSRMTGCGECESHD